MSVRDNKKNYRKIMNNLKNMPSITVGIGHFSDSGKTEDGEIDLAELMAVHELGSKKMSIPARAVYKQTFHARQAKVRKLQVVLATMVMTGKLSVEQAAKRLGSYYEGELKDFFDIGKFKKLSENYKTRPSGAKVTPDSKPLNDTGDLRRAIKWKRL